MSTLAGALYCSSPDTIQKGEVPLESKDWNTRKLRHFLLTVEDPPVVTSTFVSLLDAIAIMYC
jgi:hypothetical protein